MRLWLCSTEPTTPETGGVWKLLDAHRTRHRGQPEARAALASAAVVLHRGARQLRARQGRAGELDRARLVLLLLLLTSPH